MSKQIQGTIVSYNLFDDSVLLKRDDGVLCNLDFMYSGFSFSYYEYLMNKQVKIEMKNNRKKITILGD